MFNKQLKAAAQPKPHPADVLELLGAYVVGVYNEALVVVLKQVAELGIVLRAHSEQSGAKHRRSARPSMAGVQSQLNSARQTAAAGTGKQTCSFWLSLLVDGMVA